MTPSLAQYLDAQHAINAQHPSLARAAADHEWLGEPPGGQPLYALRLSGEQLATVCGALAVASTVTGQPSPTQSAWAAVIDAAIGSRCGAPLSPDAFEALERVDAPTLERMAALVLAGPGRSAADTPESVARKARAARAAFCSLDEVLGRGAR